ncbi:MAG: putative sulfate exporter family transporter [Gallionellaceae bacterium]|nr:putative sulfate exporter family transporter [Gallionellaceae bacterium]
MIPTIPPITFIKRLPGIAIAALLAGMAVAISTGLGGSLSKSQLLIAVLLGLFIGNVFGRPQMLQPGLQFTIKWLLRLAVILLGFRVTWQDLSGIGFGPIAVAAIVMASTFIFITWSAQKIFRIDRTLALLLAAGSSICGASAILATATLLHARPQQVSLAVTIITLLSTVALFFYPLAYALGYPPEFDPADFGVFTGATIYELAQVIGAGYAVSDLAGITATVVKLSKVVLMVPGLFLLGAWLRRSDGQHTHSRIPLPLFVFGFLAVVIINSLLALPAPVLSALSQVDVFLITMVMVAFGLETHIGKSHTHGWIVKPLLAALAGFVFAIGIGYALVRNGVGSLDEMLLSDHLTAPYTTKINTPPGVALGQQLFDTIGCGKCHVASLPAENRQIYLYSDLLLHDMGPALDDKFEQGDARGRDWRTTPLRGLGLRVRYLHDGRATSLRAAIIAHGGEAEIIQQRFMKLDENEQQALYQFLNSL